MHELACNRCTFPRICPESAAMCLIKSVHHDSGCVFQWGTRQTSADWHKLQDHVSSDDSKHNRCRILNTVLSFLYSRSANFVGLLKLLILMCCSFYCLCRSAFVAFNHRSFHHHLDLFYAAEKPIRVSLDCFVVSRRQYLGTFTWVLAFDFHNDVS